MSKQDKVINKKVSVVDNVVLNSLMNTSCPIYTHSETNQIDSTPLSSKELVENTESSATKTDANYTNKSSMGVVVSLNEPKTKKMYPCEYCKKLFNRPSALQTHTYSHTLEKPFQCLSPNCGRSFSVLSNLRRHFRVHRKSTSDNKLSSEDRIRCVQRLIKKSSNMSGMNISEDLNETSIPFNSVLSRNHPKQKTSSNRHYHYLILPAIDNTITNQDYTTLAPIPYTMPSQANKSNIYQEPPTITTEQPFFFDSNSFIDLNSTWVNNPTPTIDSDFLSPKEKPYQSSTLNTQPNSIFSITNCESPDLTLESNIFLNFDNNLIDNFTELQTF